jgi:hypothetical protein
VTALALTGFACAGCDSTQQEATRARLNAQRFLASASPTIVRHRSRDVRVLRVTLLRGSGASAIAVRLHSDATRPLNDLPISVGLLGPGGRVVYLNAGANVDYFKTHLASIAARGSATWVFTTRRPLPAGMTPIALVGARPTVPATTVRSLPRIAVAAAVPTSTTKGGLRVRVTNLSAVPQYQLQVYALELARGRYVAAGQATISHLGTGTSETLEMTIIGDHRAPSVELEAMPTMFQ